MSTVIQLWLQTHCLLRWLHPGCINHTHHHWRGLPWCTTRHRCHGSAWSTSHHLQVLHPWWGKVMMLEEPSSHCSVSTFVRPEPVHTITFVPPIANFVRTNGEASFLSHNEWLPVCVAHFVRTSDSRLFWQQHFVILMSVYSTALVPHLCDCPFCQAEVASCRGEIHTLMWDHAPDFRGLITGEGAQQRGHITVGQTIVFLILTTFRRVLTWRWYAFHC